MKPTLLVLAAGIGSRYGGLKQIESVGPRGEGIVDYSVYDALRAGFEKVVFVIRREIEAAFRSSVGKNYEGRTRVLYAHQELDRIPSDLAAVPEGRVKPWGTAHAILAAEGLIEEPFAVINADDFYGAGAFESMGGYLGQKRIESTDYAMVGYRLRDTLSEHGHVARGLCQCGPDGLLVRVVERTRIVKKGDGAAFTDEAGVTHSLTGDEIASMNFWGFTPSLFAHLNEELRRFLRANREDTGAEFYIPTVIDLLVARGVATVRVLPARARWYGMTYREDKPRVIRAIRDLIRQGVYPEKLW